MSKSVVSRKVNFRLNFKHFKENKPIVVASMKAREVSDVDMNSVIELLDKIRSEEAKVHELKKQRTSLGDSGKHMISEVFVFILRFVRYMLLVVLYFMFSSFYVSACPRSQRPGEGDQRLFAAARGECRGDGSAPDGRSGQDPQ
jgi:hypothetical protein